MVTDYCGEFPNARRGGDATNRALGGSTRLACSLRAGLMPSPGRTAIPRKVGEVGWGGMLRRLRDGQPSGLARRQSHRRHRLPSPAALARQARCARWLGMNHVARRVFSRISHRSVPRWGTTAREQLEFFNSVDEVRRRTPASNGALPPHGRSGGMPRSARGLPACGGAPPGVDSGSNRRRGDRRLFPQPFKRLVVKTPEGETRRDAGDPGLHNVRHALRRAACAHASGTGLKSSATADGVFAYPAAAG